MKKTFGFSIAAMMGIGCLTMTPAANAGDLILWDQQPDFSKGAPSSFVDQNFGDFPTFSTFLVGDVVFGGAVQIHSITTYYTNGQDPRGWPQNADGFATLNIFADPLSNFDHNPLDGASVVVSYVTTPDGIEVTASGLNIDLVAGTYWIGLTPELDFGAKGQEFHNPAINFLGAPTQGRNPGEGFGFGPDWFDAGFTFGGFVDWDMAISIRGIPAPGALALLGVAGLAGMRRRRRK